MTQTSQFALDWIKSVILILSGQADQTDVVCFYPVLDRYRHIYILYRGRQGQPTETGKGNTRLPSFHHKRGLHLTIRIKHNLQESLSCVCWSIQMYLMLESWWQGRETKTIKQTYAALSLTAGSVSLSSLLPAWWVHMFRMSPLFDVFGKWHFKQNFQLRTLWGT